MKFLEMDEKILLLAIFSVILLTPISNVEASSNSNLFVSAENPDFDNHFSGSMVVEVVVRDLDLKDTGEGKGEPDVTLNGNSLRMVQATDGNWYAYFAHVDKAKIADSTVGLEGHGLDFGVFCSAQTDISVIGISLTETDGFAIPRYDGLSGFSNGLASFSECTGTVNDSQNVNNVIRNSKFINTNPSIPVGQIGLNSNAWPLVQLFTFDKVQIQYNPGGKASQSVQLDYDEIPNIFLNLDRELYPKNSQVFLTVNDIQLNQDPTDADSWTFGIDSNNVFYQAFDNSGKNSANGGLGLVNLFPYLSSLGFEKNGYLSAGIGPVIHLDTNSEQPDRFVTNGVEPFSDIVTLVETLPNSGVFDTGDYGDKSNIMISNDAPRGHADSITYNSKSVSVLTGSSTAGLSLKTPSLSVGDGIEVLKPGTKYLVNLTDDDQNSNSGVRDELLASESSSILPVLQIGSPVTLENTSNVDFFESSTDSIDDGISVNSTVDNHSKRLIIDTSDSSSFTFEKIILNLGIQVSDLKDILINESISDSFGSNWLHFDIRSIVKDLEISSLDDVSISLYFDSSDSAITIVDIGELTSEKGLIQLDALDVQDILKEKGNVFLEINFDSSNNDLLVGTVSDEKSTQPIIFDFFSFGLVDSNDVNNSLFRFELEETSDNSSMFEGTLEYAMANQLNILDPRSIQNLQTIDDQIKFFVTDKLTDEEGISISYPDLAEVGVVVSTSIQSDILTTSGVVSSNSNSYRFGQPVTVTLNDPDLNLDSDLVDIYFVINDPDSENVDTVGKNGNKLLEILIKDIRYQRCVVDGVPHGGLGASGFTLKETESDSGIFEGTFKMPTKICNKSGTDLISSAGGSLDVKYFDSRDSSGNSNIFSLLKTKSYSSSNTYYLDKYDVVRPLQGSAEITLSGSIENPRRGIPLSVEITFPDGVSQSYGSNLTNNGKFQSIISVNKNSPLGIYTIELFYYNSPIGETTFVVSKPTIPNWIKNNANWWYSNSISDSEFLKGIEHLINENMLILPETNPNSSSGQSIPNWIKNNANWWQNGIISDDEFLKSLEYLLKKGIIRV